MRHRALRRRYGRSGFLPGRRTPKQRLSIDGWTVTYYEPTFGTRSFNVDTHAELSKAREWLDAGGHSYRVKVRP